jgi:PAS domain-containing protein
MHSDDTIALETQLRELEAELDRLRRSESEARRNSDLLMGLIELMPIGLAVADGDGHLILANAAAAERLGLPEADAPAADAAAEPVADEDDAGRLDLPEAADAEDNTV